MLVCPELQERLDKLWIILQEEGKRKYPSISQIDLDHLCVNRLEKTAQLTPKRIRNILSTQRFTDWLVRGGTFDRWIQGDYQNKDEKKKLDKQTLKDIMDFFGLKRE